VRQGLKDQTRKVRRERPNDYGSRRRKKRSRPNTSFSCTHIHLQSVLSYPIYRLSCRPVQEMKQKDEYLCRPSLLPMQRECQTSCPCQPHPHFPCTLRCGWLGRLRDTHFPVLSKSGAVAIAFFFSPETCGYYLPLVCGKLYDWNKMSTGVS
jgi:hypothetical protein